MELYASGEDYLEAILMLQQEKGFARSTDVADRLGYTKPSVSVAMSKLQQAGYVTMDESRFLHLTEEGQKIAESVYEKHVFFTEGLISVGVDPETAERDACKIEHAVSEESFTKIKQAAAQNDTQERPEDAP